MFSKTSLALHSDSLIKLSPSEQEVFIELQEQLDELSLLDNLPSEFTLNIENCCWPDSDDIQISPGAVKAITSLVLDRLKSLSLSFTLDFSLCSIGDEGAVALAESLQESSVSNLTIDLYNCDINEGGFSAIAKALTAGKSKLSHLTLKLGQQDDIEDEPSINDTIHGQINLVEVLSSPYCPDRLVIDFKYLTQDYAEKIVTAMRFNRSCLIEFDNLNSPNVKDVIFLNERNRLLQQYPAFKEQILAFSHAQLPFPQAADSTPQIFQLCLRTKEKYEDQTPQELVQFFSSILNDEADKAEEAKILTVQKESFSSNTEDKNTIASLSSLGLAINNNTEFTVFIKPQIPLSSADMQNLMLLLQRTALRNRLINELIIDHNEMLFDPVQFSFQLLLSLQNKKSLISSEIIDLSFDYFSNVFLDEDHIKDFENGNHLIQAVKTGILPIARQFYNKLHYTETFFDNEELYLNAIKSESEEMMLWLHKTTPQIAQFINRETLDFSEKKLSNFTSNDLEKESLNKGLMIFKKLLNGFERQKIQELIGSRKINELQLFLKNRLIAKTTLMEFLSLAIRNKLSRTLLKLLIDNLGEHFEVNEILPAEFVFLTNFNLLSAKQRDDFLKDNHLVMSKELTLELIRKKNYPGQFLKPFIELHLNHLVSADIFFITQAYPLSFLQVIKDEFMPALSEKFPGNPIVKEIIFSISELIQQETSLRARKLPLLENKKIEVSPNKRQFIDYRVVQLSSDEANLASQSFQRRKKIRIYVENYMPDSTMQGDLPGYETATFTQSDVVNVLRIQNELAENEYAGYLHLEGLVGSIKGHVECLIVTKTQVIKPVKWDTDHGVIGIHHYDKAASADLSELTSITLVPQADSKSCASLSLAYLKQLLKDDARQIKELCFIFPYLDSDTKELGYFFIPSPQVLRYSQSSIYNLYIKKLVSEDEPGVVIRKKGEKEIKFPYRPIKHLLVELQDKARKESDCHLVNEIDALLEQLPHFRKRWLNVYEQMDNYRSLMNLKSVNRGLEYTSRRMRKIALIEQERKKNPGLSLLKNLEEKKHRGDSDEQLLACFSDSFSKLAFETSYQLGYFLKKLAKLINSEKTYPLIFSMNSYIDLIKTPADYKDCLFFLDLNQRGFLNSYFKQSIQFSRLQSYKTIVLNILEWINIFAIPEQEKTAFIEENMPRDKFAIPLLSFLGPNSHHFNNSFEDKKALAVFLMDYIGKENLLERLPESIQYISSLKLMFDNEHLFFDFIEEHLPFNKALPLLMTLNPFKAYFCDYLNCLPAQKRSAILLEELNNFSSDLFKKLCSESLKPEEILEVLLEFCQDSPSELSLLESRVKAFISKKLNPTPSQNTVSFGLGLFDAARGITEEPQELVPDYSKIPN